ncbi:MAG: hypothetical protein KBG75_13680, partial [Pseudomonadales bacterium]|nr:hypothetical protein [Pseudomonadales bacterium]
HERDGAIGETRYGMTTKSAARVCGNQRAILGGVLLSWLAACYVLRFELMESRAAADFCLLDATALSCLLRAQLGRWIYLQYFGIAALLLVLAANCVRGRMRFFLAAAGLCVAIAALVLYNVNFGAPAAVFALLTLADPRIARP